MQSRKREILRAASKACLAGSVYETKGKLRFKAERKGDMKKLFISQPMVDRTDEEIFTEREKAIAEARVLLGEEIEVIDSYTNVLMNPLGYLGYSITCLSNADVAYFAKGWQDYRGCKIEHECALQYGIKIILSEFDPHKTVIGRRLDAGCWD